MTPNSNLVSVGIGTVAQDKNDNSRFISVYLSEQHPFYEGDVTNDVAEIERTVIDEHGNSTKLNLYKTMAVKADWLEDESNRETAPHVKKGESVNVFEKKDTSEYYWQPRKKNNPTRRAEAVTFAWSAASQSNDIDIPKTADNHYSATVDGINGHITITTSKDNGEVAKYTVQVQGKQGHVTVADDLGNLIQLNSSTKTITLSNGDNTYVQLSGPNILANANETILLKANNIVLDSSTVSITGTTQTNNNVNVTGDVSVSGTTTTNTINASTYIGDND